MKVQVARVRLHGGPNQYGGNKLYDFLTSIADLKAGDQVVVDTAYGIQGGTVDSVKATSSQATKWVVGRINMDDHTKNVQAAKAALDLQKKMEARRKAIQDEAVYIQLAQVDPEMRELVKQYTALTGGTPQ